MRRDRTWRLDQSVIFVEVVDDETSEVEKGRRRNGVVARLGVCQTRFYECDVLKERSDFRRVDRLLLRRQAVETEAERRFKNDVCGDLKHTKTSFMVSICPSELGNYSRITNSFKISPNKLKRCRIF